MSASSVVSKKLILGQQFRDRGHGEKKVFLDIFHKTNHHLISFELWKSKKYTHSIIPKSSNFDHVFNLKSISLKILWLLYSFLVLEICEYSISGPKHNRLFFGHITKLRPSEVFEKKHFGL
jgi:hypothetical protein